MDYNLPAEIVPTVAIAGAGVALSFFALLEIIKDVLIGRKHVITRLLPLTVANLINTSWFAGIIWLQYTDSSYTMLIWVRGVCLCDEIGLHYTNPSLCKR